jgi:hypothetical protein
MKLIVKFYNFLKSFNYSKTKISQSSVLMGYQGKDLLEYFDIIEDNYICSVTRRPISFKIIIEAAKLFYLTAIKNPLLFLETFKWAHTIYFICGYLKIKKITSLISFADYNPLPIYIKKILNNKLTIMGIQNSRRENRSKYFNFDYYFLLTPLRKNELFQNRNCKKYALGSLRLLLSINRNNSWKDVKKIPGIIKTNNNLILISSLTDDFLKFINLNFGLNFTIKGFKKNLQRSIIKYNQPNNSRNMRFINYLILCNYILDYAHDKKEKISVINRWGPESQNFQVEKKFFENFKNFDLNNFNKIKKYDYILSKKSAIFISDISTLSRECLSINSKCVFFNYYIKYVGDYWVKNKSIFYSFKENKFFFYLRLDKIKQLNKINYINEKKKIKFQSSIIVPEKKKLDDFLAISNLKLKTVIK